MMAESTRTYLLVLLVAAFFSVPMIKLALDLDACTKLTQTY